MHLIIRFTSIHQRICTYILNQDCHQISWLIFMILKSILLLKCIYLDIKDIIDIYSLSNDNFDIIDIKGVRGGRGKEHACISECIKNVIWYMFFASRFSEIRDNNGILIVIWYTLDIHTCSLPLLPQTPLISMISK